MATIGEAQDHDDEPEEDVNHQLFKACKRGDENEVVNLLPRVSGIDWRNPDSNEDTYLHIAAYGGHFPVVIHLVNNNADLHVRSERDQTVLHYAAFSGNSELIKYLIKKGAVVTAKDEDDATVLHAAAQGGCTLDVLKFLIDHGASPTAKTKNDITVLHSAAQGGCSIDILKFLIDHGVSPTTKDKEDWTSLHWACSEGQWEAIEYMLQCGLSLEDKDKYGRTPVDILKRQSDDDELNQRRQKCLQLLQARDDTKQKVDSTPSEVKTELKEGTIAELKDDPNQSAEEIDSSEVKTRVEEDTKPEPKNDQDQSSQEIDYKPYLQKAAAEGTVKTRRTNLGLSGASGTGKTSTLRLLTGEEPVFEHDSTPVLQPMKLFKENDPSPDSEEEESSSDLDTDSGDSDTDQPAPVRTPKRYLLIANKHKWTRATRNALFRRLANSVVGLVHAHEESNGNPKEKRKGFSKKRGMFYPFRPPAHSAATAIEGPAHMHASEKEEHLLKKSFDDLQIAKEILEFIESHKDLEDLEITHFVNVNDTGGQAAFIDIAPALMRYNSVNLILIKLDEPLNGPAKFFYSVRGVKVGTENRQISTKSLVVALVSTKMKIQRPQIEGLEYSDNCGKPQFMVLGTFYDKYKELIKQQEKHPESRKVKDKVLMEALRDFRESLIENEGKIIFPLNTLSRKKRTLEIAAEIRELALNCYVEAEVPIRWYIFQLAIEEIKGVEENKDIIRFSSFLEIGSLIKMVEEEVKAALQYLHDLTICLYYPSVLPNVVFATPQCLFDKLSEIIAVSLGKCKCRLDFETRERLQKEGIFEKELLRRLPEGFVDDLFTPDDFLKLMEHLYIACHMPGTETYFMPCVLETAENPLDGLPTSVVEPLLFTWNGTVPNGLFPSLIMSLRRSKHPVFDMARRERQYRNKISLYCPTLACLVTLFEYPSFIGVTNTSQIPERSSKIHRAVLEGISSVVKRFDWMPSVAFPEEAYLCKIGCGVDYYHLCYSDMERKLLSCSEAGYLTTKQTNAHLAWYSRTASTTPSSRIQQKRPLLKDACNLLQEKSAQWDKIGFGFGVPFNDREGLRTDITLSNEARLERVINIWLETSCHSPVTWLEFINVLSDSIGFKDSARQVQTFLEKEQSCMD